uniref:Sigma factor n=1 Tax=Erodium trifolium TaxID=337410 RepID=A0A0G2SWY3_9ROSI|nr:sigma factor [Erodium trifolium]
MEAARDLGASSPTFPSKTSCRSCASFTSPAPAVTSMPLAQKFPTSVLLLEQCDEYKLSCSSLGKRKHPRLYCSYRFAPCIHWKAGTSSRRLMATGTSGKEDYSNSAMEAEKSMDVEANSEKALPGAIQKAMLDNDSEIIANDLDGPQSHSWTKLYFHGEVTVRSLRLHERRSKKRRVLKLNDVVHEIHRSGKMKEGIERNGAAKLFYVRHRIKVTAEEELELIARTQDLLRLEEVKNRLKSDIGHEPNLVEWSKKVGISCRVLHSRIRSGIRSRDKLIYANLWVLAEVAQEYLYCRLSYMDLFMAGISGLLKSIEKFDPRYGCRFSTYAFWWVREAVYRKGVIQSYNTHIDLSIRMHKLLDKISRVRRLCIEEGNRSPTKEDIAGRMGITVDKLEKLLILRRLRDPIEMRFSEDDFVDPDDEDPWLTFEKEMMREHIRDLMTNLLTPRERQVIRLRCGFEDGRPNRFSEISVKLGVSSQRAKQLEKNALQRMRQCNESVELMGAYTCLLVFGI